MVYTPSFHSSNTTGFESLQHETLATRLYVSSLIKQILTFYGNLNSAKKENWILKTFILFFLFHFYSSHSHPDSPHSHPYSPHSHPDSPHSQPDSPHSYPNSPYSQPHSPHFHPFSPHSHPDSLHSTDSVPRFPILVFTDSHSNLSHSNLLRSKLWFIRISGKMSLK